MADPIDIARRVAEHDSQVSQTAVGGQPAEIAGIPGFAQQLLRFGQMRAFQQAQAGGGGGGLGVDVAGIVGQTVEQFGTGPAGQAREVPTVLVGWRLGPLTAGEVATDPTARPTTGLIPIEVPLDEAGQLVLNMSGDPGRMRDFQRRLYVAGFYGGTPADRIRWGAADALTFDAADRFFTVASNLTDPTSGERVPWPELLRDLSDTALSLNPELDDFLTGAALDPDPVQVALENPENLFALANSAFMAEAGRRATPEEQRAFVRVFHAMQRDRAVAEHRARLQAEAGQDVEVTGRVDPGVFAERFVREQAPEDVLATQGTEVVNVIREQVGGP